MFRRILVPSSSRSSSSFLGRLDFEDEGTTIPKKNLFVRQKINLCYVDEFKVSEMAACRRPLTVLARIRSRVSPCIFFAGQSGNGAFFRSISGFPYRYHSTSAPSIQCPYRLFPLKLNTLYLQIKLLIRVL
jgi:hypothetical protein